MNNEEKKIELEELLKNIQSKDKNIKINSLIVVFLSILLGLAWIDFSINQVNKLKERESELKGELKNKNEKLNDMVQNIDSLKLIELDILTFLGDVVLQPDSSLIDPAIDWDSASQYILDNTNGKRKAAVLIVTLLSYKDLKFNLGGSSLKEGFDSSSFIKYVLSQVGIEIEEVAHQRPSVTLMNSFEKVNNPLPGDLIFYRGEIGNFGLFYLGPGNEQGKGLGIGVLDTKTPLIIMDTNEIKPYFKERFIGYYRVKYNDL